MATPSLLLATDFSPASRIALDACWALAPQLQANVVLLHAMGPASRGPATEGPQGPREGQADEAARRAREWAADLAGAGVQVEAAVHAGPAARAILDEARRRDVAMVVMGTHGQSGLKGWFLGSVAQEVIRTSKIPVLVTPLRMRERERGKGPARPARCIVAASDLSAEGEPAFEAAVRLARDLHCLLRLVHVVDARPFAASDMPPALLQRWDEEAAEALALLASRARAQDVGALPVLHWGHPATAILAEAKASQAELVVAGTHGKSGLRRFLLGSVAQALVQAADRPVLVVPDRHAPDAGTWWR